MKDFIVLLAICLVVIGGAWWLLGGSPHNLLTPPPPQRSIATKPSNPNPAADAEKTPNSKKANRERRSPGGNGLVAQLPESAMPPAVASLAPPSSSSPTVQVSGPLPEPQEIRMGTEGEDILKAYGPPMASAYTVDNGHYFEIYVYRRDRTQATIHLRDGKVYSVFTW